MVDQFNTCLDGSITFTGPDALLVAYCSGRHEDQFYIDDCVTDDTFDYRPVLADRLITFHTHPTLLFPAS